MSSLKNTSVLAPPWRLLEKKREQMQVFNLEEAFKTDPLRHKKFTFTAANLVVDFSKNMVDEPLLQLLSDLAARAGVPAAIQEMVAGAKVNNTENRAALHSALRSRSHGLAEQQRLVAKLDAEMTALVDKIREGRWTGYTGRVITDIVNIGIGGSDLGPLFVTEALAPYASEKIRSHFVSNVDPSHLHHTLRALSAETTLFIVASKSFSTLETLTNAKLAKNWLLAACDNDNSAIQQHFIGVSSKPEKAVEFGIAAENILPMWDWVGGRYSLWSSIGLPIALAVGNDNFIKLKAGAAAMDEHFVSAPLANNIPVLLAVVGLWYYHFWGAKSYAILPYSHDLRNFPNFLQQLEMESNGKSVDRDGIAVPLPTCPVIWGQAGTNGQHSFHQLLHQGTHFIPVDFILPLAGHYGMHESQRHLVANCLSQSQALMQGKSLETAQLELKHAGASDDDIDRLSPHKVVPGNRPSTIIAMDKLTPECLGALVALYEHKVFVQSVIWGINPFDQWGVELGKQLSGPIFDELGGAAEEKDGTSFDSSTNQFVQRYKNANR